MIVVDGGIGDGGTEEEGRRLPGGWREHTMDIIDTYRRAFGEDPPRRASLAVMADTDNTGTSSRAYIDFIRVDP
jgi:hypothetical protein